MKNIINGASRINMGLIMNIKLIKTEDDYDAALIEIERLIELHPEPGTEESDRLEVISLLVADYEKEHFPFDLPDPIFAIKFVMEQRGLKRKDLQPYIGSKSRVSDVLNGKRPLSLPMIRKLHKGLNIPAEILIKEPGATIPEETDIEWEQFPLLDMHNRS